MFSSSRIIAKFHVLVRPGPTSQVFSTQVRRCSSGYVQDLVEHWGFQGTTAITIQDASDSGLNRKRRRKHGEFLHDELRIRTAQRVLELQSLPFGLPEREGIATVIEWYTDQLLMLEDAPLPTTPSGDEQFTNVLTQVLEAHTEVIQELAFGVQDLMAEMGPDYMKVQPEVDACLRRFFLSRIGLRFLLQHHIESFDNREGHSGILQLDCSASEIAKKAAEDSKMLCKAHLGQAPAILISERFVVPGAPFTYVPMHMHYMLTEIFKNACRAVVERHADGFDNALPVVTCQIVHGHEDVTLKISDEGGGISRDRMADVWKFMYSTYKQTAWSRLRGPGKKPNSADSAANPLQRPSPKQTGPVGALAGYGVGLTLSKLYAQYFGGDLSILSLDGLGTDVYLSLNRLGTGCESLPKVMYSPSMRDSTLSQESQAEEEEQFMISHDELAFLRRELEAFRRNSD